MAVVECVCACTCEHRWACAIAHMWGERLTFGYQHLFHHGPGEQSRVSRFALTALYSPSCHTGSITATDAVVDGAHDAGLSLLQSLQCLGNGYELSCPIACSFCQYGNKMLTVFLEISWNVLLWEPRVCMEKGRAYGKEVSVQGEET